MAPEKINCTPEDGCPKLREEVKNMDHKLDEKVSKKEYREDKGIKRGWIKFWGSLAIGVLLAVSGNYLYTWAKTQTIDEVKEDVKTNTSEIKTNSKIMTENSKQIAVLVAKVEEQTKAMNENTKALKDFMGKK